MATLAATMAFWTALPAGASQTWTVQPTPAPPPAVLSNVSCLSAANCTAVGDNKILQWSGGRWTVRATAPAYATLSDVACTSATRCIAVGSLGDSAGNYQIRLLAEIWNGTSWKVQTVPNPATPSPDVNYMSLNAVKCLSPTDCLAVGFYSVNSGADRVLIEKWNGVTWAIQQVPSQPGALGDVTCQSATSCFAVGDAPEPNPVDYIFKALIEHWNGSSWTVQAAPTIAPPFGPAGVSVVSLTGISCPGNTALRTWT